MDNPGEWMSRVDHRVLEYLDRHDPSSPVEMMREGPIRYTPEHIAGRCKVLALHGMVRHLGEGVYGITANGEAYLADEVAGDAEDEPNGAGGGFEFGPREDED